jgi:hypothetical protein
MAGNKRKRKKNKLQNHKRRQQGKDERLAKGEELKSRQNKKKKHRILRDQLRARF